MLKGKLNKLGLFSFLILGFIGFGSLLSAAESKTAEENTRSLRLSNQLDDNCRKRIEAIYDHFFDPTRGLHTDREVGTTFQHYGRLSTVFNAVGEAHFDAIFNGDPMLTFEDLEMIFYGIKDTSIAGGDVAETGRLERLIVDLRTFWPEARDLLEKDGERIPVGFYDFLTRLQKVDKTALESGKRDLAARTTIDALNENIGALLDQMIQEEQKIWNQSSKLYDRIYLFWSPHYSRALQLVKWAHGMSEAIQTTALPDGPVDVSIDKHGAKLTTPQLDALQELIENTPANLAEIRTIFKKVFGRELTKSNLIKIGELRIRNLMKKIASAPASKETREAVVESRQEMDELDYVMNDYWQTTHGSLWPVSERENQHLQIRFLQYQEETPVLQRDYHALDSDLPQDSDYKIKAAWNVRTYYSRQVKKTKKDADGKEQTYYETERTHRDRTETGRFTKYADYGEVLEGRITPSISESELPTAEPDSPPIGFPMWSVDSAENGTPSITWVDEEKTSWILSQSQAARDHEKPLRHHINQRIQEIEQIIENYPKNIEKEEDYKKLLKWLEDARAELVDMQAKHLEAYKNSNAHEVSHQWPQDIYDHFKSRNQRLSDRYLHLVKRIDHLREEIKRKLPSLDWDADVFSFDKKLDVLRKSARKKAIKKTVGAILLSGALAGGAYLSTKPEVQAWTEKNIPGVHKVIDKLNPFSGK